MKTTFGPKAGPKVGGSPKVGSPSRIKASPKFKLNRKGMLTQRRTTSSLLGNGGRGRMFKFSGRQFDPSGELK